MIEINKRKITISERPYIIAELSANHNGSIIKAKESIKVAKECGADAIKIQTYTPESMTIDSSRDDFKIKSGLWKGYKLYDLYKDATTPYSWHEELFKYARQIGITLFSTPFDENAVDLLENLDTPAYKIASFELTDLLLIEYIAKKKKPILLSTGLSNDKEVEEAINVIKKNGNNQILIFHCISSYPADISDMNIRRITNLRKKFELEIGLSDHSISNLAATTSIALGAVAIEKHFTLNKNDKGPDSEFSIEPNELKELVSQTNKSWEALGDENFIRSDQEIKNKIFRRSLYFVEDMEIGEVITNKNVRRIRPGFGLEPKYLNKIMGKKVTKKIKSGDRVEWNSFDF